MRRITGVLGVATLGLLIVTGSGWAQTANAPATSQPTPAKTETKSQEHKEGKALQTKESRHAARKTNERYVRGRVTAVETSASPETLTMNVGKGKHAETVGVDVPASTKILEGTSVKTLGDVKVGDQVALRYVRQPNHLVAQQIRTLRGTQMRKASTHASKPAMPKQS